MSRTVSSSATHADIVVRHRPIDRWIPWMIVGFFAVFMLLDAVFVYLAMSSHRGVVTEKAYEKGLAYNETVAAADAQQALGWQGEIAVAGRSGVEEPATIGFILRDAKGALRSGAEVQAKLIRPTQAGYDRVLLLEETEPGHYIGNVHIPLAGQWDIRVAATWQGRQYQQRRRVVIP